MHGKSGRRTHRDRCLSAESPECRRDYPERGGGRLQGKISYPYLEPEDIDACLSCAALIVDDEELAMPAA